MTAIPPSIGRPSFVEAIRQTERLRSGGGTQLDPILPSRALSIVALLLVTTVLALAGVALRRRGDRVVVPGMVVAGMAVVVALFTAAVTPVESSFGYLSHKVHWLRSAGAFVLTVAVTAVLTAARRSGPRPSRWASAADTAVALAVALLDRVPPGGTRLANMPAVDEEPSVAVFVAQYESPDG